MKKILMITLIVLFVAFAGLASADWSVTVTWTKSPSAALDFEEVLLDGVAKCNVLTAGPATCNFTVADLIGQAITIRSTNTVGINVLSDPPILLNPDLTTIDPATGVMVNVTFVAP